MTISRTRPSTREIAVAIEKTRSSGGAAACRRRRRRPWSRAVSWRACRRVDPMAAQGRFSRGRSCYHRAARELRAFSRYGQHQAAEEARPDPGARAPGEPSLPLDDQDADEAARDVGGPRATPSASPREHRELVRTIDRATARGALHKNTAARKKSQAAKLAAGAGPSHRFRAPSRVDTSTIGVAGLRWHSRAAADSATRRVEARPPDDA